MKTFYEIEVNRIEKSCFHNKDHISKALFLKKYIDRNYGENPDLEILAIEAGPTKFHLHRIFKKYHGLTPRQYLIDVRVEKAKAHLKKNESVSAACFAVGFESLGSFSNLFKAKTGKTPSVYQKEQVSIRS